MKYRVYLTIPVTYVYIVEGRTQAEAVLEAEDSVRNDAVLCVTTAEDTMKNAEHIKIDKVEELK